MKNLSKEDRTRLWWEFTQNICDALDHEDISADIHGMLCDMLDNFVPIYRPCADYYRGLLPGAIFDLMPDDLIPPRSLKRDEDEIADIFNELGENVCGILKDDRTPEVVRNTLTSFMAEFDRLAQKADPERYRLYHAQMMFPPTLDIMNNEGRGDDEEGDASAPQCEAVM